MQQKYPKMKGCVKATLLESKTSSGTLQIMLRINLWQLLHDI